MSLAIRGMGWVTPLGDEIDDVWQRLLAGEEATAETVSDPISARTYPAFRVSNVTAAHPRLRRSSAISRFAVGAGLSALRNAGVDLQKNASRTALVFATSNGGVIYTKRFYHDIVTTGAQAASPLLFPETVFNAPASHLAAILGITGASYTLVGDAAVGILALQMADDLMCNEALDYCLVVAAEEVDWLLCDAYRKWRLLRNKPPIEPFAASARGMILSEGAGAVLLGRDGRIRIGSRREWQKFCDAKRCSVSLARDLFYFEREPQRSSSRVQTGLSSIAQKKKRSRWNFRMRSSTRLSQRWVKEFQPEPCGRSSPLHKRCSPDNCLPFRTSSRKTSLQISEGQTQNHSWKQAVVSTCGLNQQTAGLRLIKQV